MDGGDQLGRCSSFLDNGVTEEEKKKRKRRRKKTAMQFTQFNCSLLSNALIKGATSVSDKMYKQLMVISRSSEMMDGTARI